MQRGLAIAKLTAITLIMSTLPAVADGMRKAPSSDPYVYNSGPIAVDYNWSGVYVGGHAGGAYTQWDWIFTSPTERLEQSHTGFAGGGQIGIQRQWGRMLVGAEVSYTWADMDETIASTVVAGTDQSVEVQKLLLATGRLGVAQDNLLAYAKAGYATADVEFRSAASGVVTTSSTGREHGWVAGVGMDYGLTPNISIGVEYNYIHLNVDGREQIPTPAGVGGSRIEDGKIDIQTVMARLNFKFGPRAEVVPFK